MLGKKTTDHEFAEAAATPRGAGGRQTSVIAKGMKITGHCETRGLLRIDGTICGDVRAVGLELAGSGSIQGSVSSAERRSGDQPFVIAGRVDGAVSAGRVEVRSGGVVLGGVDADDAAVQGRVDGGIVARNRLALGSTAVVEGDVRAQRMSMEDGGQVNGTMYMGERAGTADESDEVARPALRSLSDEPSPSSSTSDDQVPSGAGSAA